MAETVGSHGAAVDEFVHYHEGKDLSWARDYIRKPHGPHDHCAVHVFPDVQPIVSGDQVERKFRAFKTLNLRRTSTDGVFVNDEVGSLLASTSDDLWSCLTGSTAIGPLTDTASVERLITSSIEDIAAGRPAPIHAMNYDGNDTSLSSALKEIPLHITPENNSAMGECPGINVPSCNLSGALSVSPVQPEDGLLDLCNLVRWGVGGAENLWLFIHPDFSKAFCVALQAVIQRMRDNQEDVSSWLDDCAFPHYHKNIVVTPEFLRAHDIHYQVVRQHPGTLVYAQAGLYHQILSTGILLAESVNVGGPRWNAPLIEQLMCFCPECATSAIPRNLASIESVEARPNPFRGQPIDGCLDAVASSTPLGRLEANVSLFACRQCASVFATPTTLEKHVARIHSTDVKRHKSDFCPTCNCLYDTRSLTRHKRLCKGGPVVCDRCRTGFTAKFYKRHRERCNAINPSSC